MARDAILIVDDDEPTRTALARVLRRAGFQVTTAANGEEGFALARELQPWLVLTDMVMPVLDGMGLCRRIKAEPSLAGTLVVVCSARRTSSDEQAEGLDAGADGYLGQPISSRELVARVEAMLRIRRAEEERDRLIVELREALATVKVLRGLIPICSHCKRILDDQGYWNRLEQYLHEHTEAEFTHALCPACLEKHYPRPG
jgi:DNA-binding response OmpR family regulator